ncbi:hypothetical protein GGF46_001401 [Coemansia sp. RSA 552]|nr:hypothetical protein GGF46_001401 [Coemansia sp. RSA 552]
MAPLARAVTDERRAAFLAVHTRDGQLNILYVSSGVYPALGFTQDQVSGKRAPITIADNYGKQGYADVFNRMTSSDTDEAGAYVMYLNLVSASGSPVLTRVTSFNCDNCIIVICTVFPEAPFFRREELAIQVLEGRTQENRQQPSLYQAPRQLRAALVLETPEDAGNERHRPGGALIVFATGSISRLIEVDPGDVMSFPFLKLVAPEDVLHVGQYFERLSSATDVMFETFALLQRPHVIDGDVVIDDADNSRVVVECLGADVQDGVALLLRKIRVVPAPKRDTMGNYIHPRTPWDQDEGLSLAELISSDPETSDAPGWSLLD